MKETKGREFVSSLAWEETPLGENKKGEMRDCEF